MDKVSEKNKIYLLIFLLSFAFSAILMPAHLLYDEFWSLLNFAELDIFRILTDLSLPNNHPLNTLMLKIFSKFSDSELVLRLPSLLCGAAIPVLCGKLAYKWSCRNHTAAMISAAALAILSAPITVYNGQARGYAMQLFFLLLCVWAMSCAKDNPRRSAVWMAIGGAGTILTVPTGVLFLLPAAAGFLIFSSPEIRQNRDMWIGAGVIAVTGILFYGINFSDLKTGQSWGNELDCVSKFGNFLTATLSALTLTPAVLAAIPAFFRPGKRLAAAGLLFIPLILSVFSNGGPERCYLYLAAAIAVAGGIALAEFTGKLRHSTIIAPLAALLLGGTGFALQYRNWRQTDYIRVFDECRRELPPDTLPVLRSTAGFPVLCGIDAAELEEFNRRMFGGKFTRIAIFECENGVFNGLDDKMSENTLTATGVNGEKFTAAGLAGRIYEVHPVEKISPGECALVIFTETGSNIPEILAGHGQMLYLNAWLTRYGKIAFFNCCKDLPELPENVRLYRIGGDK